MKKLPGLLLSLTLSMSILSARGEELPAETDAGKSVSYGTLLAGLALARREPSERAISKIDADISNMNDDLAKSVAEHWKKVWIDPGYRLCLFGTDDPAQIPVTGRHAFVILGYTLESGEMAEELTGRCNAAAAVARVFPESILVCSGGATGENNPEGHTEAGLMKRYLTEQCRIAEERIHTDERAMDTEENARNTLAILQKQHIETMTVITSSYHQRRGQTLYNALAGRFRQENGYTVELIGNYSYPVEKDEEALNQELSITVSQLGSILDVSEEQINKIRDMLRGK